MSDRRHADQLVTRRLWEEVCSAVLDNWEELDAGAQDLARNRVIVRWRSLRDRFKREFNKEMQAPSGSRGRRSRYKYARALTFLRSTLLSRSTVCSTREPASELHPSGAISQECATGEHVDPSVSAPSLLFDPSAPSSSAGAAGRTSSLEAAGDELEFPLPHPSDTAATSRPPLGSGRQRQRGQETSYAPEFLHLNAAFQNAIKLLGEQTSAGYNMVNRSILELSSRLDRMHLDAKQSPRHCFFQSVLRHMENLSPDLQMHVMQGCHTALAQAISQAPQPTLHVSTPFPSQAAVYPSVHRPPVHPPPVHPPPVHPPPVHPPPVHPPSTPSPFLPSPLSISQYLPSPFHSSPLTSPFPIPPTPSPYLPQTTSAPQLPAQPHVFTTHSTSVPPRDVVSPPIDVARPVSPSATISTPNYENLFKLVNK
ncbi:equilibrative nucleoside transporter 2 isoform X3 [Ranitomeya variabilis]|uniref:equilibrative nucleoside transporter 2 isoform X3 n=1 Tax=Ranitomeya variabilis TaxID=490064 RepID=UPI00405723FF